MELVAKGVRMIRRFFYRAEPMFCKFSGSGFVVEIEDPKIKREDRKQWSTGINNSV